MTVDYLARILAAYQHERCGSWEIHLSIIQKNTIRVWAKAKTQTAMAQGMRDGGAVLIMGEEFEN